MKNSVKIATALIVSLLLVATVVVVLDTNLVVSKNPDTQTSTTTTSGSTTRSTTTSATVSSTFAAQPAVITKVQSGLVASDPLTVSQTQQELLSNKTYWAYGGTAAVQASYYGVSVDGNQLQIGVASPAEGQWVGYYAVSPPTNATLANAELTAPSSSLPGHYSVGLYVQATNQMLNYVGCVAVTTPQGTTWEVVHDQATDSTNGVIVPLWGLSNPAQKLTEDCTIITNGTNYLKVYLNHVVVYQSNTLQLAMQAPFNFYLESESSTTGGLIYGGYQNFYAAQSENVQITNAPSSAVSAAIVDAAGNVLATAPVTSGTAVFTMGQYVFPQVANVELYSSASDAASTLIGSTPHAVSISGGDVFTYGPATNPSNTSMLSINAVDTTGNPLNGISAVLAQSRNTVASGYLPVSFSLTNAQSYSVTAADFGVYTFDHWSDGSTLRTLTLSVTRDTELTAVYRVANASAPQGMSLLSVRAVNSNNSALSGFGVSVWQSGSLIATSFSPNTFLLRDGVQYQVVVSSYGNFTFEQWSDGMKTSVYIVSGSSTTPVIDLVAVYSTGGNA
jgi:hypothetical protein